MEEEQAIQNPISQCSPGAAYREHRAEIDAAVQSVLESGWYIKGRCVSAFEREFAAYLDVPNVLGVGNGTDALQIALRACRIGPGDAVLTVSHTAVATVAAIELVGATPLLVDIDPVSFTMDPQKAEDTLRQSPSLQIKALLPVHLYGRPAALADLKALASRYGLFLIEDCAQSHGALYQGRRTGNWGNVSAFSFYPTKNLGALGDGGAVATGDSGLAERARLLAEYGWRERYISSLPGGNTRLDEVQAAILSVKLRCLEAENERRREIARRYDAGLQGLQTITMPEKGPDDHVYHQYVVRCPQREALKVYLQQQGIGTLVHYPLPIHLQPAYRARVHVGTGGLGVSEAVCASVLSLPMFPQLADEEVERVVEAVRQYELLRN